MVTFPWSAWQSQVCPCFLLGQVTIQSSLLPFHRQHCQLGVSHYSPHSFLFNSIIHTTGVPVVISWGALVFVWLYLTPIYKESRIKSCTMQTWVNNVLYFTVTSRFLLTTAYLFQLLPFHKIMRSCVKEGLGRQSGPPCAPQQSSLSVHILPDVLLNHLQRFPAMEILITPVPVTA